MWVDGIPQEGRAFLSRGLTWIGGNHRIVSLWRVASFRPDASGRWISSVLPLRDPLRI